MKYSYLAIFGSLMLGIIGVPVPDELLLLYLGYDCSQKILRLEFCIPVATAAIIVGITVSFVIGRWVGMAFIHRFGKYLRIRKKSVEQAHGLYQKVGHWALVIGFFIPGMRHITAVIAGAAQMTWKRFAIFAYGGATFWAGGFIIGGYFAGAQVPTIVAAAKPYLHNIEIVVFAIIAGVIIWQFFRWWFLRLKLKRELRQERRTATGGQTPDGTAPGTQT